MNTINFIKAVKRVFALPLISWGTVICIFLLIFPAMLFSQSGEKYSVNMNSLGPVDKFGSSNYAPVRIFTNSTLRALFTADGNFEAWYDSYFKKNVTVDSTITAWEMYAMYRLSVYGDVVVTGIMKSAKLILTDGNITSITGTVNFGSNNLTTTGNITAGSFRSSNLAGNGKALLNANDDGDIIRKEYSGNPNEVLTGDGNWSNLSQSTGWQWVDTNLVSTAAQVVVANNLAVAGKITVGQMKVISNGSNKDTLHTEKELVIITDSKNISLEADTVKIPRLLDSKRMETDTLNSKKINASKVYVAGDITSTGTVYTGNLYVANDVMLPLFAGTKNLLLTDSTGKVSPLGISSTSNKVLLSNGTWGAVPIPQNYWQMQNDDIYTLTPGNIGLGMNNPAYKLDVAGTVRISEDLLVGGGIVISEKVNATRELKSASLRADSIFMDNTKAFYGESRFADSVKIQSKLRVDGNIDVGGDLRSSGSLIFGGDKTIGFRPAANGFPDIIYFTSGPIIEPQLSPCFNPNVTIFQKEGIFHSYGDNVDGNTNNMYVGFDGADGVIDIGRLVMFPATIEPKLLINKFCGKDVHICTGTNGGNIQLTGSLGKVGIGIEPDENSPKLDIAGDVRISSLTPPTGTYNVVVADGTGLLGTKAASEIGDNLGDHTATQDIVLNNKALYLRGAGDSNHGIKFTTDFANAQNLDGPAIFGNKTGILGTTYNGEKAALFWNNDGNVGIGTMQPLSKLQVGNLSSKICMGNNFVIETMGGEYGDEPQIEWTNGSYLGFNASRDNNTNQWLCHQNNTSGVVQNGGSLLLSGTDGSLRIISFPSIVPSSGDRLFSDEDLLIYTKININKWGVGIGDQAKPNNIQGFIVNAYSLFNGAVFINNQLTVGLSHSQNTQNYRLAVNGIIGAKEVIIENNLTQWPDYVFDKNYSLMPLSELESYIDTCKHLPDIPSANEIKEKGIAVGELNSKLLKKLEEFSLYLIQQDKVIKQQQLTINELKSMISALELKFNNK